MIMEHGMVGKNRMVGGGDEMVWGMGWVGKGIGRGRMEWWGNGLVEGNGMVGE